MTKAIAPTHGISRDYYNSLLRKFELKQSMTDKEKNDLKLWEDIYKNEEIIKLKARLNELS